MRVILIIVTLIGVQIPQAVAQGYDEFINLVESGKVGAVTIVEQHGKAETWIRYVDNQGKPFQFPAPDPLPSDLPSLVQSKGIPLTFAVERNFMSEVLLGLVPFAEVILIAIILAVGVMIQFSKVRSPKGQINTVRSD